MNRVLKQVVMVAVVPMALAAQGAVGDARPISLDEAVKLALLNQPTTVAARNQIRQSEASVKRNFYNLGFIPTLGIGASANQRGGDRYAEGVKLPNSATPWSYGRQLNIGGITLFDGGTKWNAWRQSQAQLNSNEASLVTQRYTVALQVKTAYYNVVAAREQRAAAQRQLDQAQQQLAVASAKVNVGSATRTDSLTGAISVGTAKQAILTADNAIANANAALTRYAATPFTVTAVSGDSTSIPTIDVSDAELVRLALAGPLVTQNTAQLRVADAQRRSANAPYMPQLTMSLSYGWTIENSQRFQLADGANGNSTGLGFNFNYNIWDNYAREQSVVQARLSLDNAEATLKDNKFVVQQNLTQQLNTFRTAVASIELNQLQIASAEENLRVVQQQYNLGTKQLLDLVTAQRSVDDARAQLITSRQNARIAKANIEQIIGRDLK